MVDDYSKIITNSIMRLIVSLEGENDKATPTPHTSLNVMEQQMFVRAANLLPFKIIKSYI